MAKKKVAQHQGKEKSGTSIRIDPEIKRQIRIKAAERDVTITGAYTQGMTAWLSRTPQARPSVESKADIGDLGDEDHRRLQAIKLSGNEDAKRLVSESIKVIFDLTKLGT